MFFHGSSENGHIMSVITTAHMNISSGEMYSLIKNGHEYYVNTMATYLLDPTQDVIHYTK